MRAAALDGARRPARGTSSRSSASPSAPRTSTTPPRCSPAARSTPSTARSTCPTTASSTSSATSRRARPARSSSSASERLGLTVCEDIWEPGPPASEEAHAGATLIVNISASPYHAGKGVERERMLAQRARDNLACVAFCGLVGGQDELVFDGHSCVIDHTGQDDRARGPVPRGAAGLRRRPPERCAPPACATPAIAPQRVAARSPRRALAVAAGPPAAARAPAPPSRRPPARRAARAGRGRGLRGALPRTARLRREERLRARRARPLRRDRLRARRLPRRRRARRRARRARRSCPPPTPRRRPSRTRASWPPRSASRAFELPIAEPMDAYEATLAEAVRGPRPPTSPRRTCRPGSAATC